MEIKRDKLTDLEAWKEKPSRKPLILNGARQVGKSWLVKEFGKSHFKSNLLIINFEKRRELHAVFERNLDVIRIIKEIEIITETKIIEGKTLLFFDEIQECPNALMSLRYFYEEMPNLHLIAAGSLLDFAYSSNPYPVGRVETLELQPISFVEFLYARGRAATSQFIKAGDSEFLESEPIKEILEEEYRNYVLVGGMPACVSAFAERGDFVEVEKIQYDLLYSYEQDFKKYRPQVADDCLLDILSNASKFIGGQIIYTKFSERFTSPTVKKGLELLKTARLLHSVENVSISRLPFTSSGKQFKVFYLDIGLMLRKSGLGYKNLYFINTLSAAFQGALAEQFVAQQLIAHHGSNLKYWARTEGSASSEIDFVLASEGKIIPVEVKAGKKGALRSLNYVLENYPNIEKAIVYSKAASGIDGKIHYLPIWFAGIKI